MLTAVFDDLLFGFRLFCKTYPRVFLIHFNALFLPMVIFSGVFCMTGCRS